MSTDTETRTVKLELEACNPSTFEVALKKVGFGQLLEDLSAPTEEELTLDANLKATLSKAPLSIFYVAVSDDGGVAKNEPLNPTHSAASLPASGCHIDKNTRVLTCGTYGATNLASGDKVKVSYSGLTKDTTGAAGTKLKEILAGTYGR